MCAGTAQGVAGDCWGDSGGPLVTGGPDAWLQIGVVIGGDACAAKGYYDLYTHVDQVSAWARGPLARTRKVVRDARGSKFNGRPIRELRLVGAKVRP